MTSMQVGSVFANAAQTQLHAKTAVWLALYGRDLIDIDIVIDAPMILLPKRHVDAYTPNSRSSHPVPSPYPRLSRVHRPFYPSGDVALSAR